MNPIFILSLPRSGSTLLQRMLTAHSAIASVSEPWLLLPLAGVTGENGARAFSEYSTRLSVRAVHDFVAELPDGIETYRAALREMVQNLYSSLCHSGEEFFLDKTPRYFLITDFLFDVFPDAKVVFLFRHPLDVLSSIVRTSTANRLRIHHWHVDLFEGPVRLHAAYERYADRVFKLHYETLVEDPQKHCRELALFLGIDYEDAMVAGYRDVKLKGSMGDKTGELKYQRPESKSIGQWKDALSNAVRRRFALRYVNQLGADVLGTFGVSLDEVRNELSKGRMRWHGCVRDLFWLGGAWVARYGAWNVLRNARGRSSNEIHKLD